jgi:[acyl-carrier-protein] S-malonyltransferase
MKTLIGQGAEAYIELAPGKVLCGLLKQIDPAQKSMNVEDLVSLEKTLTELAAVTSAA